MVHEEPNRVMKDLDIERLLTNDLPHFYSFAFVLIPDDLQASQLVVDSISQLLISDREILLKKINDKKWMKESVGQKIFELAQKRFSQIRLGIDLVNEHKENFYKLDIEERAALFLKEVSKLQYEEIAWILNKTSGQLNAILASARYKLFDLIEIKDSSLNG